MAPKFIIALASTAAVAALTGCNRGDSNQSASGNIAPANTGAAEPSMPNAVLPAGEPVDQAFVARTWGMDGCERTLTFHADGTLTNNSDTDVARWALVGGTLTITPPGEAAQPSPVVRQGDKLLMGDGPQLMTFTPCPAGAAAGSGDGNSADAAGKQ